MTQLLSNKSEGSYSYDNDTEEWRKSEWDFNTGYSITKFRTENNQDAVRVVVKEDGKAHSGYLIENGACWLDFGKEKEFIRIAFKYFLKDDTILKTSIQRINGQNQSN